VKNLTATICLTITLLLGSVGASWSADWNKGLTAFKSGDYATALREWTPLADKGNARAQNAMGSMYGNGLGVPKDYKTAVKWYRLSAENGEKRGQFSLGLMYASGKGVPLDYKTALKWWTLAAKQGHARAQWNLGVMYEDGDVGPKDYKTAVKWYTLAAKQGFANAQSSLIKIKKLITVEEKEKQDQVKRQANSKDIITTIPDGRMIVLYDDGTWKILQSSDAGKIIISVASLVPGKDADGYDTCKVTARVKNMTEFKIKNFFTMLWVAGTKGKKIKGGVDIGPLNGRRFSTGDTIEKEELIADWDCANIDYFELEGIGVDKRTIKKMRFKTDKEAKKFISNLLAVSSDHDYGLGKIVIGVK
jgi:hypothetical protein